MSYFLGRFAAKSHALARPFSTLVFPPRVQNSVSFSTPENTCHVSPSYLAFTFASSKKPILGAAHPLTEDPESPHYQRESIILGFHSLSTGVAALASLDMNSFLQAPDLVTALLKVTGGEVDKPRTSRGPDKSLFISVTPRAYRDQNDLEKITPSAAWSVKKQLESRVESEMLLGKLAVLNLPPIWSLKLDSLTGQCYVRQREPLSDHDRPGSLENLNARHFAKVVLEKCKEKAAEPKNLCFQTDSQLLSTTPVFSIRQFLQQARDSDQAKNSVSRLEF